MTAQFWNALRDIAWLIGTLGGLSLLSIGIGVAAASVLLVEEG